MASFKITGKTQLSGEITPQGAKNEALQILCAVLLTDQEVIINNIPDIIDVNNLISLLENMGVDVRKLSRHSYAFRAQNVNFDYLHTQDFYKTSASLRGSVMIVGPMVARFKQALIPKPGGDKIGRRKLDTHFIGLQKLGADFNFCEDSKVFQVKADKLKGTY